MFLYFTDMAENGDIKAIYNGRFAFVKSLTDIENADKLYKNIIKNINPVKDNNQHFESLEEEFIHSEFYAKCFTALVLNGLRWVTRILWLILKNDKLVQYYYEFRTYFYIAMYEKHEKLRLFSLWRGIQNLPKII